MVTIQYYSKDLLWRHKTPKMLKFGATNKLLEKLSRSASICGGKGKGQCFMPLYDFSV